MKGTKTYTVTRNKWCMFTVVFRFVTIFLLLFLIILPSFCLGAEEEEELQYDEVTVYLNVQGIGGADARALIKDGVAYLSISDVFTLLKIKNNPSARLDSLSGFFINTQDEYLIDRVKNQINFQGKKIELNPADLFLTETSLYMKVNLFGEIFGLNCDFSFRELSVILTTKLELPLIREMKIEQMRTNIRRLKGEIKTDTIIGRSYPLFKFGMVDWAIANTQQQGMNPNTQLNLAMGAVVAGGEMNVGLHYDQTYGFDSRQQSYLWRYVNNDFSALRQVLVGKIMPQTISVLNGALVGIQLTNTPSIYRRSFGTYTLSNVTDPGWLVELYVNNVLVDYVKADASGFYKFEVPLVYGNTVMMVRMYGPWGEVRTRIENANIPFSFLPPGEMEYAVNAGVIENQPGTKFYRTNINYGISRRMSIQGGYEHFSSPSIENSLPYIGSSIMLNDNMLLSGEYTLGVRLKSSLSYRLPYNLQLNLDYTGYEKGQKVNQMAPLQINGLSISAPIQGRHFSSYTRLSLAQSIYREYKTTNAEFLFSGNINGVSSNVTTMATYQDPKNVYVYSDFSLSFRLPHQITLIPSAQYNYNQQQLSILRCNLEKPLFGKGYLNIMYENNLAGKTSSLEIGLRYDFSVMQSGLSTRLSKNASTISQSASGSLLFDRRNKFIGATNTSNVGRGGLTFLTFLDLNGNGKRDKGEQKIVGLNIRVNGGRIVRSVKDSTIRVIDLTPYTSYLVELDKNSIQNISWKIKNMTLSVSVDPNQFKTIEIPVEVMAEVSGIINVKKKNRLRGQGGLYVCFYRNQTLVGRTLTEGDGYYSYMGLQTGEYVARLDSTQLTNIRMTSTSAFKRFTVEPSKDGDFVEGIDFTIQSIINDSIESDLPKNEPKIVPSAIRVDSIIPVLTTKISPVQLSKKDPSRVQISIKTSKVTVASNVIVVKEKVDPIHYGASISATNALSVQQKITASTGRPAIFILEDGVYKLWIVGFTSRTEAEQFVKRLSKIGFQNCMIKVNPNDLIKVAKGRQYSIQVGAYIFDANALSAQQKIMAATGLPAIFVLEKGFYKLWIVGSSSRKKSQELGKQLETKGFQNYVKKSNSKIL